MLNALQDEQTIKVGFTGEFGPNRVSPRELTSSLISSLVNVEGIVTKCSLVRPKVVKSVHFSETTGQFVTKQYRSVFEFPNNADSLSYALLSSLQPIGQIQAGDQNEQVSKC